MPTILLELDPQLLANPDADLRYVVPELLCERSGGLLVSDGYEYTPDFDCSCT